LAISSIQAEFLLYDPDNTLAIETPYLGSSSIQAVFLVGTPGNTALELRKCHAEIHDQDYQNQKHIDIT